MAKTTKPLTNTEVTNSKPKVKEYNLSDGGGLALRVKPNGSKLWLFNYYKPYSKKRTSISFGMYPTVTIKMARDKREDAKVLLDDNIDPKEHREAEEQKTSIAVQSTLEHITNEWMEVKKESITIGYSKDIIESMKKHLFPALGN